MTVCLTCKHDFVSLEEVSRHIIASEDHPASAKSWATSYLERLSQHPEKETGEAPVNRPYVPSIDLTTLIDPPPVLISLPTKQWLIQWSWTKPVEWEVCSPVS